jgi:DNA-binding XRE family transcriptional regulator
MRSLNPVIITPAQLRAARALLDWSRAKCGEIVGISRETVKNIEQGKFVPTAATVEKIVKSFSDFGVEFVFQHGVSLRNAPLQASGSDGAVNNEGNV